MHFTESEHFDRVLTEARCDGRAHVTSASAEPRHRRVALEQAEQGIAEQQQWDTAPTEAEGSTDAPAYLRNVAGLEGLE